MFKLTIVLTAIIVMTGCWAQKKAVSSEKKEVVVQSTSDNNAPNISGKKSQTVVQSSSGDNSPNISGQKGAGVVQSSSGERSPNISGISGNVVIIDGVLQQPKNKEK